MVRRDLQSRSRKVEVKVNPLPMFLGVYEGEVNYRANRHFTVGVRALYVNSNEMVEKRLGGNKDNENESSAYLYGVQAKYFPGSSFSTGFYVGGSLGYFGVSNKEKRTIRTSDWNTVTIEKETVKRSDGAFVTTAKFGYQWAWKSGFIVSSEVEPRLLHYEGRSVFFPNVSLLSIGVAL